MDRERKYFNEPLVKTKISWLHFPRICPVCCSPSTSTTLISATPRSKQWLRPHWNPTFYASDRRRISLQPPASKSFLVHVCEEHHITDEGNFRMRGLSMLLAAILGGMSIFALIFTGYDLSSGRGIHPIAAIYIVALFLSLVFGYVAFRPTALEASVKIIGFDFDIQNVWFQFENPEYRMRFIEENQMGSEIVNWIVMA
ncbi:MAG: hypothetical protein ACFFDV_09165 [Candidatus Thorarchaeota archaeon]